MRSLYNALALGLLLCGLAPAAPAQTPPVGPLAAEELFGARRLSAEVSPSGRYLALVQRVGDKDRLVVIDLEARVRTEVFNSPTFDLSTISSVHWKGDERLVFMHTGRRIMRDKAGQLAVTEKDGQRSGKITAGESRVLYVVPRTGGEPVRIPTKSPIRPLEGYGMSTQGIGTHVVLDPLVDDPDHMLMVEGRPLGGSTFSPFPRPLHLQKVNLTTGEATIVETGEDRTRGWVIDRKGKAILRYDIYGRRGGLRVMGRTEGETAWRELFTIRERDLPIVQDLEILGATDKPGTLFVSAPAKDRSQGDTRELRLYDFVTKTMGERLFAHPRYDIDDVVQYEDGGLAAVCYWAETYRCDYLDKARQAEAEAVDKFFEGERNIVPVSRSRDGAVQILSVSGPDEPGSLYLFNRKAGKVELLGAQWPKLAPDRLGVMTPWRWTTRDGVEIGGYLTAPPPAMKTAGPLPLIVMPHGGPEVRDNFTFDRWGQAFATRGYLVFQPNFRGSGGFGASFAEQGYGQWGLRMQDDVLDGVAELIKQGKVDPNRICIVGASYGGYVALQGGARNPELFKCVVSRAGLSDLVRSQKWERETLDADSPRYRYWLKSVGDPKTDEARLKAASPATYAAGYGPPVLLIHGDQDWTVPIEQSEIMEKALKKAGRPVIFSRYEGQGHGGWAREEEIKALKEMLDFVDKHLGPKR
ncbi:MAG TPA: S9 family peptidase [Caulobacter sp.]|nr:S9 family peptidase [Caulobacter sp.]